MVPHEQSATGKNCNMQRVQQEKGARKKHCNDKEQDEKISTRKSATWKWCSMKRGQHEKSAI